MAGDLEGGMDGGDLGRGGLVVERAVEIFPRVLVGIF